MMTKDPEQSRPLPRPLPYIPYPVGTEEFLADRLFRESTLAVDPQATVAAFMETGELPSSKVSDALMAPYLVCLLADCCNEVVRSFNVIVDDLEDLPAVSAQLRGRASVRLQLLIRVFLSEAYRGKEIAFRIVGEMRRRGFVDRDGVKHLRALYKEHVDPYLEIRHNLQHGEGGLTGQTLGRLQAMEVFAGTFDPTLAQQLLADATSRAYAEKIDGMHRLGWVFRSAYVSTVFTMAKEAGVMPWRDRGAMCRALGIEPDAGDLEAG